MWDVGGDNTLYRPHPAAALATATVVRASASWVGGGTSLSSRERGRGRGRGVGVGLDAGITSGVSFCAERTQRNRQEQTYNQLRISTEYFFVC